MEQALKPEEQAKIDAREVSKKHRASIDAKVRAVLSTGEAQGNVAVEPVANEALERLKKLLRRMDYRSGEVRHEAGEAIYAMFVALASSEPELRAEIVRLTREVDNLKASLTARAKSMLRVRDALAEVHDNIEDEGDRAYFGSTNDADTLKEVWQDLDGWAWDDIMADGELPDVYEASRKAHTRAEAAESRVEALSAEVGKLTEAFRPVDEQDWQRLFLMLPDSGFGCFWKEVLSEVRAALDKGATT